MLISAFLIMTLLPLQVTASTVPTLSLDRPIAVVAFVDMARILGLPNLKLRDSKGNRYQKEKIIMQEPMAVIQESSGGMYYSQASLRKAYIQSYVRR